MLCPRIYALGGPYLPLLRERVAGDTALPSVWFGFSCLFFVGLIFWAFGLRNSRVQKQHIHHAMTVLVTLKVLTMVVNVIRLNYMASEGTGSGWHYVWLFLYGVKGATLFVVIVLIGSGWSFVQPSLSSWDRGIFAIVVPLQLVTGIALVLTEGENMGNSNWTIWRDVLHVSDIICSCAVLWPILWSIKRLRKAVAAKAQLAINEKKLITLFQKFYVVRYFNIFIMRFHITMVNDYDPTRCTCHNCACACACACVLHVACCNLHGHAYVLRFSLWLDSVL
jgi:hypothetical protein